MADPRPSLGDRLTQRAKEYEQKLIDQFGKLPDHLTVLDEIVEPEPPERPAPIIPRPREYHPALDTPDTQQQLIRDMPTSPSELAMRTEYRVPESAPWYQQIFDRFFQGQRETAVAEQAGVRPAAGAVGEFL